MYVFIFTMVACFVLCGFVDYFTGLENGRAKQLAKAFVGVVVSK